jgi:ABC-2 type transport system permease protein
MTGALHGALAPYRAVVSARFRMLLQYRAAALAGLWTQVFFGAVLIMIYEAFYRSSPPAAQPMAFAQVVSYVWLGQALFAMLPWNADPEIRAMVRTGAVAYELCRPVDLYSLWFARAIAQRTAPVVLRAAPMVAFAATLASGAGFAAALACGFVLVCAISTLINITLMWTISGEGIVMVMSTAVSMLSGLVVPLPMLPEWAQPVLRWLPFSGVFDLPFRIYNGHIATGDLALVLARQLGWAVLLVAFGRWLLGRGMRRVVVQGG